MSSHHKHDSQAKVLTTSMLEVCCRNHGQGKAMGAASKLPSGQQEAFQSGANMGTRMVKASQPANDWVSMPIRFLFLFWTCLRRVPQASSDIMQTTFPVCHMHLETYTCHCRLTLLLRMASELCIACGWAPCRTHLFFKRVCSTLASVKAFFDLAIKVTSKKPGDLYPQRMEDGCSLKGLRSKLIGSLLGFSSIDPGNADL